MIKRSVSGLIFCMSVVMTLFFNLNAFAEEAGGVSFYLSPGEKQEIFPSQDMAVPIQKEIYIEGIENYDPNLVSVETKPIQIGESSRQVDPFFSTPTYRIEGNIIFLTADYPGNYEILVRYQDTEQIYHWNVDGIRCEPSGIVLEQGESSAINVANSRAADYNWVSENEEAATVSEDGVVSGLKEGNAIIKGVHITDGYLVGCTVSVVTAAKKSVISRAKQISKGTYSQAKRMSQGFYDCSSLVWRAYRDTGVTFGVAKGSAPVAANEAAFLAKSGRIYTHWSWDGMQNMKYQVGDVVFRTNAGAKRYGGINHVEMLSGYELERFDPSEKAEVLCTWVNRPPGYSRMLLAHDILGRP